MVRRHRAWTRYRPEADARRVASLPVVRRSSSRRRAHYGSNTGHGCVVGSSNAQGELGILDALSLGCRPCRRVLISGESKHPRCDRPTLADVVAADRDMGVALAAGPVFIAARGPTTARSRGIFARGRHRWLRWPRNIAGLVDSPSAVAYRRCASAVDSRAASRRVARPGSDHRDDGQRQRRVSNTHRWTNSRQPPRDLHRRGSNRNLGTDSRPSGRDDEGGRPKARSSPVGERSVIRTVVRDPEFAGVEWRWRWDLNPRRCYPHTLSRRAPLAARTRHRA